MDSLQGWRFGSRILTGRIQLHRGPDVAHGPDVWNRCVRPTCPRGAVTVSDTPTVAPHRPPPPTGLPVMAVYWLKLMFWESPETSCRSDSIITAKSCDLCAINNRCWLIPSWLMDHSLPVFLSSAVKLAHKKRCVNHWRQGAYHCTDPMTNTVDQPWEKAAGAD